MPANRTLLKSARLFHLYSGVFLTPALLFFAFTGAVQSMNFHETTRGSNYKPPAILVKLAQLHKKETLVLPERKPAPPVGRIEATVGSTIAKPPFDPSHLGDHTNQQKHDRLDRSEAIPVPSPALTPSPEPPAPAPKKAPNTLPLKIFSFWTGVGLFLSTLTGLFMAYKYTHNKIAISATLAAGILIPGALLLLQ